MANDAARRLEDLTNEAGSILLSPREVTRIIASIAPDTFAKRIRIEIEHLDQTYVWGATDALPKVLVRGDVSEGVEYRVYGEYFPETSSEQSLLDKLRALPPALWRNDIRPMGGLGWKFESIRNSLSRSVSRLVENQVDSRVAAIYADLDNFKKLNDDAGHARGDEAIRMVNREMHNLCGEFGGIPFHPSGDEFYLILPADSLLEMMDALQKLKGRIMSCPFKSNDGSIINVDITMGVEFLSGQPTCTDIDEALRKAEASTRKPRTESSPSRVDTSTDKRRGKISFALSASTEDESSSAVDFLKLGTVLVRRTAQSKRSTFNDPRLGLIELIARRTGSDDKKAILERVEKAISWLDVEVVPTYSISALLGARNPHKVPAAAIALAIASGLLQNRTRTGEVVPPSIHISISVGNFGVRVDVDGSTAWERPGEGGGDAEVIVYDQDVASRDGAIIGVQVGFNTQPALADKTVLPEHFFSKLVVVDDRPNSGGGLPDFWQAAVALVCKVAASKSGGCFVVGWGSKPEESDTIRRLRGVNFDVDIDEMSTLSSIPSSQVRDMVGHISKTLKVVGDFSSLVSALYENSGLVWEPHEILESSTVEAAEMLRRRGVDRSDLGAVDGVRCQNAGQAYPTVIDILRREAKRVSADDAHQELRELTSFKIVLEDPLRFVLPSYLAKQHEDVSRYARSVLLDPNSRLGGKLREDGQYDAFIQELASCYVESAGKKSTRRALLVVPHRVKDGRCTPEGLVSVWASPRIGDDSRGAIDWVFTWRTVEAFIGLPYSMFGSIRFAEGMMDELRSRSDMKLSSVEIGTVTYVALSLHMRVDGVHPRIAKMIVDSSSD